MGYPDLQEEMEVLNRAQKVPPIEDLTPVIDLEGLLNLQREIKEVFVDDTMKRYIVDIVNRTRGHGSVYLGASPRGSIALMKAAQAYAYMYRRDYVLPDDIQYLARFVLSHRIILKSEAKFEGISAEELVNQVVARVPVPVQRLVK
jgi:MoxR-like ATPase